MRKSKSRLESQMRSRTSRGVLKWSGGKDLYMESCCSGSEKSSVFSVLYREGSGGFRRGPEVQKMFHRVQYSSMGCRGCALTRGVGPCPHYPRSCGSPMQVGPTPEPSRTFPVQYRKIPNIFLFWLPEKFRVFPVTYRDHREGPGGPPGGATAPEGCVGQVWEGTSP